VSGELQWTERGLRARFRLEGDSSGIFLPPRAERPARRDELWRATCFELFLGRRGEASYVEINVAPSGDWNAYAFSGYREGMAPADAVVRLDPARDGVGVGVDFAVDVELAIAPPLEVGVTAVLAHAEGNSYWALAHPGEKPDFHRRDAWLIRID
jgi:hypothetical protein